MSQSLLIQSLGIPTGLAGWQILQKQPITSFTQFMSDPILKANIAYFKANIGNATTAAKLLADPRLQQVALTAYGLTAQIGANGLMTKVLNSNLSDTSSIANKLVSTGYKTIAAAFGYGNTTTPDVAPVASSAQVSVDGLDGGAGSFGTFSGTFGCVTLSNVDLSSATTPTAIAQALTTAFQSADGGKSNITVTNTGFTLKFSDSSGNGTASGFAWTANPDSPSVATATAASNLIKGSVGTSSTPVAATASKAQVALSGLDTQPASFGSFSGTFGGVTLSGVDLQADSTPTEIASALQTAFRKSDNGSSNISVTVSGNTLQFSDAAGRGTASSFTWSANANSPNTPSAGTATGLVTGNIATLPPGTAVAASSATVAVGGLDGTSSFGSFSGTIGGVTVQNVNLQSDTTAQSMAVDLQAAFRKADGGATNISVTVDSTGALKFSDAAGRGTASGFTWYSNANSSATPTAAAPTNIVAGNKAVSSTANGPNVKSSTFVNTVITKYEQAMFDQVVGNSSSVLSNALYAQQNLSGIKSWYSVIADTKLATVVETAMGLPSSFQKLDVDQQNAFLSSKMSVKDLSNTTKVNAMLNKYVAIATAQADQDDASTNPALGILTGNISTGSSSTSSMSSGSIGALLISTSVSDASYY